MVAVIFVKVVFFLVISNLKKVSWSFECVIAETEVRGCLQLAETEWKSRFPNVMKPGRENLLVFLSTRGKRAQRAAAAAADLGYNG